MDAITLSSPLVCGCQMKIMNYPASGNSVVALLDCTRPTRNITSLSFLRWRLCWYNKRWHWRPSYLFVFRVVWFPLSRKLWFGLFSVFDYHRGISSQMAAFLSKWFFWKLRICFRNNPYILEGRKLHFVNKNGTNFFAQFYSRIVQLLIRRL